MRVYREQVPLYQDVWDWDIVLIHGDVRVICNTTGCLWEHSHPDCDCAEKPRLSSPVIDRFGKRMVESAYMGDTPTGEARCLLDVGPGSEVTVMSGKTYRLNGPRTSHESFSSGSIWAVYEKYDATPEQPGALHRFFAWLGAA